MGTEALLPPGKEHHSLLLKAVVLYLCIMGQHNTGTRKPQSGLYCIAAGDQPARRACGVCAVYDEDEAWQLYKNVICSPQKTA